MPDTLHQAELQRRIASLQQQIAELEATLAEQQRAAEECAGADARQEREGWLRILFDQAADAIYVAKPDGQLVQANEQACRATGYSREELLCLNVTDVEAERSTPEALQAFIQTLSPGRPVTVQSKHRRKDGSIFPVEITLAWLETSDGLHFLGIARDITERLERELEYAQILRTATDGFWVIDSDGHVVEVNPAGARMLGYTPEELSALTISDIDVTEGPDEMRRHIEQLQAAGAELFESRHRRKDGTLIDVEVSASFLPTGGGRMVAFIRDITERKRAESEREITLQLLRQLSSATGLHDLMAQITRLMKEWSGCEAVGIRLREGEDYPYFETRGFPEAFVLAENSLCAVDAQGELMRDALGNPVLECMCGNVIRGRFDPSLPFFTKNGSFWTNSTTDLLASTTEADRQARTRNRCHGEGYESVALIPLRHGAETFGLLQFNDPQRNRFDESRIGLFERLAANLAIGLAQRRAAEALRTSEEKFARVFQNAPVLMTLSSVEDGRYLEVNDAFVRVTGYSREVALGATSTELGFISPDDRQRLVEMLKADGRVKRLELSLKRADGAELICLYSGELIETENGRRLLSIASDITERKRAEEEKARLEEQIRQSQKLEAIGRLAGGVAHDFNNILTVILGHTEMALAQAETPLWLQADLAEIRKAAERSADLTRQLLAFARKQTIAPQVLDLNETVDGMLKMLRRLIGEDIDLAWLPSSSVWPVKVDPSQIDQILANLCINARDAIGGVGRVTIETENVAIDETYVASRAGFVPGQYVLLAVSDDGCGMDKETLANIFEPFFTTKGVDEGTGLGLATVYGVVKQNNGFINVYSEPGLGTTFKIYLPRHVAEAKPMVQKSPATQMVHGQETILLVEDEPAILRVGKLMLERFGYRVLVATTPEEAMQLAGEHAGNIHLLVTDVVMPEMNGRDLADYLNALYPDLRRLYMSGYTANVIAHHGVLEEGVNFIEKPFSMQALAAKVRAVLDSK